MNKHKYSDNCCCVQCTDTWNKALFAAVDRGDAAKAKKVNVKKVRNAKNY